VFRCRGPWRTVDSHLDGVLAAADMLRREGDAGQSALTVGPDVPIENAQALSACGKLHGDEPGTS